MRNHNEERERKKNEESESVPAQVIRLACTTRLMMEGDEDARTEPLLSRLVWLPSQEGSADQQQSRKEKKTCSDNGGEM